MECVVDLAGHGHIWTFVVGYALGLASFFIGVAFVNSKDGDY